MGLSERDEAILDLERTWRLREGRKADLIQAELGLTMARYRTLLTALVEQPEAMAHDPLVVRRVRRERERRRRTRYEGRSADEPRR